MANRGTGLNKKLSEYTEKELRALAKKLGITARAYENWPLPKLVDMINNALEMRGEEPLSDE